MSEAPQEQTLTVHQEDDAQRADIFLATALGISRAKASSLVQSGALRRGAQALGKSDKVHTGDNLTVQQPQGAPGQGVSSAPSKVPGFEIVYQDEDLVVVNKPVGVAAHPSQGWVGPTVVDALKAEGQSISTSGASERQGIVHRLDVGTSGLMVVAKSEHAYTALKRAFKERTVTKTYRALVQGLPEPMEGTIDAPIGRHPGNSWKFAVLDDGRNARTHYQVLEAFGKASLVNVDLETGRTHQIRVHFSAMKHPLAGDLTYGANPRLAAELGLTRQWLHAYQLGFEHPRTGEKLTFTSEYPQDLQFALAELERSLSGS